MSSSNRPSGDGRNTFIIETHSEHLLLRIMRRMRETSTGKLPDGIPGGKAGGRHGVVRGA